MRVPVFWKLPYDNAWIDIAMAVVFLGYRHRHRDTAPMEFPCRLVDHGSHSSSSTGRVKESHRYTWASLSDSHLRQRLSVFSGSQRSKTRIQVISAQRQGHKRKTAALRLATCYSAPSTRNVYTRVYVYMSMFVSVSMSM